MKKVLQKSSTLLALLIMVALFSSTLSEAAITSTTATLKWKTGVFQIPDPWQSDYHATSNQILSGNFLYTACENQLIEINRTTGAITRRATLAGDIYYTCFITLGDGMIFVPLFKGQVQAIDITSMKSLWVTKDSADYSNTGNYTYQNGKLYGTKSATGSAISYCISTKDQNSSSATEIKDYTWNKTLVGTYYWNKPTIVGNYLISGTEQGNILVQNITTGAVISSTNITTKIRSTITYNVSNKRFYVVSHSGLIYHFQLTADGQITQLSKGTPLTLPNTLASSYSSSSTPVINGNRVYVFSTYTVDPTDWYSAKTGVGNVLDLDLNLKYQVTTDGGINSTPLVQSKNDTSYVYFTKNNSTGGLYGFKDTAKATTSTIEKIYEPVKPAAQYCTATAISDTTGNLYYSNDSGTIFALAEKSVIPVITVKKPAAVTSFSIKIGKQSSKRKKVTIAWNKSTNATSYQIYSKNSKQKKYTKLTTTANTSYSKKFTKGTYSIQIRSLAVVNKITYYSSFSKTKSFKITIK